MKTKCWPCALPWLRFLRVSALLAGFATVAACDRNRSVTAPASIPTSPNARGTGLAPLLQLGRSELRCDRPIGCLASSADGSHVAIDLGDEIEIRESSNLKLVRRIPLAEGEVAVKLAIAAGGRFVAAVLVEMGSEDITLFRVWIEDRVLFTLKEESRDAVSIAFSQDGSMLAGGSVPARVDPFEKKPRPDESSFVWAWELPGGKLLYRKSIGEEHPVALACSGAPSRCRIVCESGAILDVDEKDVVKLPDQGESRRIRAAAITPDGRNVMLFDGADWLRTRDLEVQRINEHLIDRRFGMPVFAHTTERLPAWCSLARSGITFDDAVAGEGRFVECLPPSAMAGVPGGVVVSTDFCLQTIPRDPAKPGNKPPGHLLEITGLEVSRDGRWVASASRDRTLRIWSTADSSETACLTSSEAWWSGLGFSPDGQQLAVADTGKNAVEIRSVPDGRLLRSLKHPFHDPTDAAFGPDGRTLATSGRDGMVRLWNVQTGQQLRSMNGMRGPGFGIHFNAQGSQMLLVNGVDLRILEVETGRQVERPAGFQAVDPEPSDPWMRRVSAYPLGPGSFAVLRQSGKPSTVGVWTSSGRTWERIFKEDHGLELLPPSPDASVIPIASDRQIEFLDVGSGATTGVLKSTSAVSCGAWSADGRVFACGLKSGAIQVWAKEERK